MCTHELDPLIVVVACDGGVNQVLGPGLVIDLGELRIPLPSEGDYREGVIRLSNTGGADVMITSLTLTEDDDSQEQILLDAVDGSGPVMIERELHSSWRGGDRRSPSSPRDIEQQRTLVDGDHLHHLWDAQALTLLMIN